MQHPFFFGYGSLVNRRTHDYGAASRARLRGWRRCWQATDARPAAYLTVVPDEAAETDGLIAAVPGADWDRLDAREAAYERHDATAQTVHESPARSIAVYAIAPGRLRPMTAAHPILLSYLDVVIQGFLAEYGAEGAEAFFQTTLGWDGVVLNDRAAPQYPRAQPISDAERAVVDLGLATVGARIVTERPA